MMQTAMAQAFAEAGYSTPKSYAERLAAMMREAIAAGGGKADASRDHFIAALHRDDDRAELLWELFAPVRAGIIGRLFTETLIEMRAERAQVHAGKAEARSPQGQNIGADPATQTEGAATHALPQGHTMTSAPSVPNAAAEATGGSPQGQSAHAKAAAPVQKPSRLVLSATADVARMSILRTFRKIGNRPLAEVTGAQAREWLKNHQRDGRFVSLVSYQVPDEKTIGSMVPDDEAERLYKLATEAGNA